MNYELECKLCPDNSKSVYIGESSRSLFTRSREHLNNYRQGINIKKHQDSKHPRQEPVYTARVTARTRDCLSRQVREAVLIRRSDKTILNGESEWHQPALYRVQQEVEQG